MYAKRILIVDDDLSSANYMALALADVYASVSTAGNGRQALLAMERQLPHLVVSDLRMPEMDGVELLMAIEKRWPHVPVILASVLQDAPTIVDAVQKGAINYLVKPVLPAVLRTAVAQAMATTEAAPMGDAAELGDIIGVSGSIQDVRHQLKLASRADVNILITGATGTGKELVARTLHALSTQARGPLVAHNCAATPPDMFESQFFGHRRGAFTGAQDHHVGLLEQAHGGVLFLDELECLSPAHQAKLLRVLEDGEVRSLGARSPRTVAVRYFAATNHDPAELLRQGRLREDLYYRLRGFEICLPLLCERPEDLFLLAENFLEKAGGGQFTWEAKAVLQGYSWPGNVRELRNVVLSAYAVAPGARIGVEHLDPQLFRRARPSARIATGSLKNLEREAIRGALASKGGNRIQAARVLGINRSTLRRKMARYDID